MHVLSGVVHFSLHGPGLGAADLSAPVSGTPLLTSLSGRDPAGEDLHLVDA